MRNEPLQVLQSKRQRVMFVTEIKKRRSYVRRWLVCYRSRSASVIGSVVLAILSICFITLMTARYCGIYVNTSSSAPIGLYRSISSPVERGSLVAVCLTKSVAQFGLERGYLHPGACATGAEPVLKRVIAVSGDVVQLKEGSVFVNDRLIASAPVQHFDSQGRELPNTSWTEAKLQRNEVFLFSSHSSRSWDSRYYGLINAGDIVSVVVPFIVIES